MFEKQEWIARLLEKHGIATVFSIVLLAGGWRLADAHLAFLEKQSEQMTLQTQILSTIADAATRHEAKLAELRDVVLRSGK